MGLISEYLSAALRQARYKPSEGGFIEASVPGLAGVMVRGRTFEECRERLQDELELYLARTLLAHEALPEIPGASNALQTLALEIHPGASLVEQTILQTARTILEEVRLLRRGGGSPEKPRTPEARRPSFRISEYVQEAGLGLQPSQNGLTEAEEKIFERVSGFLGERYGSLEGLYQKLKAATQKDNGEFQYSLASLSQQDIGINTQLCTLLKEGGLLKSYTYSPKQRRIYGRLADDGKTRGLITGGWLERYARQVVQLTLRRRNIPHDLLLNPVLLYPNGDRFEVDLLLRTPQLFLLLECKTGGYEENLERHQRIAADLRIPAKQVLYLLLGVPEAVLDELSRQWGFTFVNEKTLSERLERLLG
ncbi:type II toxin-antitoxin system HicB family antitoxin [Meiothermus ruber]|jgi:predicted RNase H-like HicB family nuclease|uniref:Type II toxin-antitoxin system HicB family antitoxin n=1 Tax=Meiothermus ruber (strain ATCC 35948 / DSM 1279 / VKM B-1258 / 21) TaxID=504728 RepID=D3PNQ6_MEIRD|nr:type II toxin-antitoxin system HicB family antitoxin [Meiothermus ruber]GIW32310.1 MAG: hypothetical protein KatS3mg071_2484 [Meiothermus sp.]ADD29451.1 hypothetical protein Mrub_2702 [Meiothermus ruber DSM 1279]AGK05100.1 hypothetical protein K649_09035 [Meiothermus ruber DSM 1279]MCL6529340.1 type II toxin-antitoxin system HicB family antitoxin [Meiothermus ruber]MCX7802856.1 type II toxin-antitoxin system HicB family antitoxin [Meiothermus ruber]